MRRPRVVSIVDLARRHEAARAAERTLREALEHAKRAGAPRLADRIRHAIKSAGGAVRHSDGRVIRTATILGERRP